MEDLARKQANILRENKTPRGEGKLKKRYENLTFSAISRLKNPSNEPNPFLYLFRCILCNLVAEKLK